MSHTSLYNIENFSLIIEYTLAEGQLKLFLQYANLCLIQHLRVVVCHTVFDFTLPLANPFLKSLFLEGIYVWHRFCHDDRKSFD